MSCAALALCCCHYCYYYFIVVVLVVLVLVVVVVAVLCLLIAHIAAQRHTCLVWRALCKFLSLKRINCIACDAYIAWLTVYPVK